MVYKFFNKKTGSGGRVTSKAGISVNEQLAEELHKLVTEKFKWRKVYSRFKGNIWAADLAEMESLHYKNKNVKYLLSVIDVFTRYAWVKTLKDKKGKIVLNAFIEIANESNRKLNKLWVDQGREFYNKRMQGWFDNNDILMYSTHSEVKSVIIERFIKILKAKIYKKITANNNKSYLSYLNKLVEKCNNAYHHSINKKPIITDYSVSIEKIETSSKAPKFKVNDRVRITKYKNNFSKGYIENLSREIFIESISKTNPWTCKLKDLNREEIIGSFYEKELLLIILWVSCYAEPDSHIRDKVKVVLDLSNYATEKELNHATGVDTSDSAAKKYFIALKAEVDNLDINKLVNAPNSVNNVKTKVDDLDVGKLKTSCGFEKIKWCSR